VIRRGPEVEVSLYSNHGYRSAKPVLLLSSQATISSRSDESPPTMIRQKPEVDLSFDASARTDGTAPQMAWAKSRTSDWQSPAEMRYAATLHSSLEKDKSSEGASLKSSSKPQAININKLSEKVYSIIERKLRIDRERRGIYA
jgi:hypothetical protein